MAEDRDVVDSEMHDRIFGDVPFESPLSLPGANGQDQFRDIFEQMKPTNAGAFEPGKLGPQSSDQISAGSQLAQGGPNKLMPTMPALSPAEAAKAVALRDLLLKMIRGTNITAALPAHDAPMVYSEPIDLSATYTLPAAAGDYTTVVSFTVPSGRWARISGYGVDVDGGFTYDGSILWRLTVNGLAVPTLSDWGQHRGTIAIPRKTFFLAKEDQTIAFQVKRATAAGGTNAVTMALIGWTWVMRKTYDGTKASITAY